MNKSSILTAFNDHFFEFLDDVIRVYPDNRDTLMARNSLWFFRKANPKLLVQIWNNEVVGKYREQIEGGNIDYFIQKDYTSDFENDSNQKLIMEGIDRFRYCASTMTPEEREKIAKYLQNLTKLSGMYSN
jgi:hypothetical protein